MLTYQNSSDTLIVVLHEIYGINDHIAGVCQSLADSGYDVLCSDLLDGKPHYDYEREEEAYRYFMNFVGLEPSAKWISFLLRQEENEYKQIFLIGYSIGATIAWLCSGAFPGYGRNPVKGVIGYYGSRIRDYLEIDPKCPTLLLFPEEEKSFDPSELQDELLKKEKVEVHILEGKHGFADPYSANYNEKSARDAIRIAEDFLGRVNDKGSNEKEDK